jgi:omega-3 fatty acid desaturase (delta-15 desaturase)
MPVTESFKIMASLWLFVRALAKAVILYINESKAPKQNELKGRGLTKDVKLPEKLPSIVDIKRVLPRKCFDPKVSTSMFYFMKDVLQVIVCYLVFSGLHTLIPLSYWPTMIFYWAIQGTFFTAVFVLGHDCGHGSFSHYPVLNDIVGNITHSWLLVPYYMWKLSHKHHHKNNANFEKDEVFYPIKKSEEGSDGMVLPGFGFGVGWFWYITVGYSPRNVYHFNVFDPMFIGHVFQCCCSFASFGAMCILIYSFYMAYGFLDLFNYYLVPLFIFGCYIVIITFLHHSEMNIPWYSTSKWDFVRGQLSTIDRPYGIVHSTIHNIGTHQMHHMFIKIPHYHLEEATKHFRAAFPDLVRICDEPIMPSFLRMFKRYDAQKTMDDDTEVYYYKEISTQE